VWLRHHDSSGIQRLLQLAEVYLVSSASRQLNLWPEQTRAAPGTTFVCASLDNINSTPSLRASLQIQLPAMQHCQNHCNR
jgi:hypothetical protein